jgi:hypothetical protein
MGTTIILYGSRARGEIREGADVDLIAAGVGGAIGSPRDVAGVSLHLYPQAWLLEQAAAGNLFVYHVAFEGVPLLDEETFFNRLRAAFEFRSSYAEDILVADRAARALLNRDWGFDTLLRRRYFWAIRTIIIDRSATSGAPIFSSRALEGYSEIEGLARHIDNRSSETFESCRRFGSAVLERFGVPSGDLDHVELLNWLARSSEIGRDTVRLLETKEAIDEGEGLRFYM